MADTADYLTRLERAGWPAFPSNTDGYSYDGMTLRDYFAGQALARMDGLRQLNEMGIRLAVKQAYELADAMLKAREG